MKRKKQKRIHETSNTHRWIKKRGLLVLSPCQALKCCSDVREYCRIESGGCGVWIWELRKGFRRTGKEEKKKKQRVCMVVYNLPDICHFGSFLCSSCFL